MPVTDAERLGWQRRAVAVLAGLLERAEWEGLPLMDWSVPPGSSLVARPRSGRVGRSPQHREDWQRWCAALGVRGRETTGALGTRFLSALAEVPGDGAGPAVTVAIMTEVLPDDEETGR